MGKVVRARLSSSYRIALYQNLLECESGSMNILGKVGLCRLRRQACMEEPLLSMSEDTAHSAMNSLQAFTTIPT